MPTQRATRTRRSSPPASDRSLALFRKLLAERDVPELRQIGYENALAAHDRVLDDTATPEDHLMTQNDVSSGIDSMINLAPKPRPDAPTIGFYELDGRVFRVRKAARGTHLYALVLTGPNGESEVAAWHDPKATDWTFAPGMMGKLNLSHRMSVERAEELSRLIARCIRCDAELENPVSVARGMGPVCRKKMGQ